MIHDFLCYNPWKQSFLSFPPTLEVDGRWLKSLPPLNIRCLAQKCNICPNWITEAISLCRGSSQKPDAILCSLSVPAGICFLYLGELQKMHGGCSAPKQITTGKVASQKQSQQQHRLGITAL